MLWDALAVGSPAQEALWPASAARYTARWNAILEELGIATCELEGLTPGSMRGGGATALFEAFEDADHVRRRMRVSKTATAELYIQEVGGQRFPRRCQMRPALECLLWLDTRRASW